VKLAWKILLAIWILDSAGLALLFGSMILHGRTPEDVDLAEQLGRIWGACAGGSSGI
jgi:hypothetical protein